MLLLFCIIIFQRKYSTINSTLKLKSITLQHIFKHIHSIHENYNSIHVHRKIRGNIFVVDFIRSNLKFLHHPLLFFTFIVNAGQYLISFEVQTMLTKFRQKMLMGIRASNFQLPISLVLIEEEEEKKKRAASIFRFGFIRSKLRNNDSNFVFQILLVA